MTDLSRRSIEIILGAQAPSGAYPACQEFPNYRYSWFRDGSFVAHAMLLMGEQGSASKFHHWAAAAINSRANVVERAVTKARRRVPLGRDDVLHTRYAVDGRPADDSDWPNFQLDGFGTWLWSLAQYQANVGTGLDTSLHEAADLTAAYLSALWRIPCYDCWEEFPDRVHPHTLAAIAAGLVAHQTLAGADHEREVRAIRRILDEDATVDGAFVKSIGIHDIDGSLVGLATPYGVVAADDPRMEKTVGLIESTLMNGGGVHRYSTDTYYGGGEWVLLTAWLAWHHRARGRNHKAQQLLAWVEAQADEKGYLPEQVPASLNDPSFFPKWVQRWGEVAKPLLWSHAMYLLAVA